MFLIWIVLLAASAQEEDVFARAAAGVELPSGAGLREWAGKGEREARLVGLVSDRARWAEAFRRIEERTGLFPSEVRIQVVLEESDDPRPARGSGKDGRGEIRFNMRRIAAYLKKVDEFEEIVRSGRPVKALVPPVRLESILVHELTHVVAGVHPVKWLTEGLATWAAGDEAILHGFTHREARVGPLDGVLPEEDAYARGMAFFSWMEETLGSGKRNEFVTRVFRREEPLKESLEAVAGRAWDEAMREERAWSETFLARFKPGD